MSEDFTTKHGGATHHMQSCRCLNCGHSLNAASSTSGKPIERPKDGDITVCIKCGAVMAYDGVRGLRGLSDAEIHELMADTEKMDEIAHTVQAIRVIQAQQN